MRRFAILAVALTAATPTFAQSFDPAYRYSGTHAGGPADDLIPTGGILRPVRTLNRDPAYRYSGTHAGGPANDLISMGAARPAPVRQVYRDPAYRYSGTHAGGPADELIPE
jgi:hypothetical protein